MRVIRDLAGHVFLHRVVAHQLRAVGREDRVEVGFGRALENILGEQLPADFDAHAVVGGGELDVVAGGGAQRHGGREQAEQRKEG